MKRCSISLWEKRKRSSKSTPTYDWRESRGKTPVLWGGRAAGQWAPRLQEARVWTEKFGSRFGGALNTPVSAKRAWVRMFAPAKPGHGPDVHHSGAWLNKEWPINNMEYNGKRMRKLSLCRSGKISKIQEVKKQSTKQYVFYALSSLKKIKRWGK